MKKQLTFILTVFVLLVSISSCDFLGMNKTSGPEEDSVPKVDSVLTFTVKGVTFKMIHVDSCTFTMGATGELAKDAEKPEKPAHQVTLQGYYIGETEVTQELWQAVMGGNPSWFNGWSDVDECDYGTNLQRPVEYVSWKDCQGFVTKLNQLTGKNFRLPTEAEWECAARGGNKSKGSKYAGGNRIDDVAWFDRNATVKGPDFGPHVVATKAPNELGLYDMSGNEWEWCQDWFGEKFYAKKAQTNPTGPSTGSGRVIRGGGWINEAKGCRVSFRSYLAPSTRGSNIGLRLAL